MYGRLIIFIFLILKIALYNFHISYFKNCIVHGHFCGGQYHTVHGRYKEGLRL